MFELPLSFDGKREEKVNEYQGLNKHMASESKIAYLYGISERGM